MMYLYSGVDYLHTCTVSMGMQFCIYVKCYKINVKNDVAILILIYTQKTRGMVSLQWLHFSCLKPAENQLCAQSLSRVQLFNDKTNFMP